MIRFRAILLLTSAAVLGIGCQACSSGRPEVDANDVDVVSIDHSVIPVEASFEDRVETAAISPWHDGSFRLLNTPPTRTAPPPTECGAASLVAAIFYAPNAANVCLRQGILYGDVNASWAHPLDAGPTEFVVLANLPLRTFARCQRDAVVVAVSSRDTRSAAVIGFEDPTAAGRVLWSTQWEASVSNPGALLEFVATDVLLAWTLATPEHGNQLFVAGPHGESPRVLAAIDRAHTLRASGRFLVYADAADIWVYEAGRTLPENLTHDAAEQWLPSTDGVHVVWMDQRDTPTGGVWNPDNPEVYSLDLTTRETLRVTHDPATRPVGQSAPVVAGDWIVWSDFRNALRPNPSELVSDRMELYGFNYVTGREYAVLTGSIRASIPAILDGRLYFSCMPPPPDAHIGLFSAMLPTR